VAFNQEITRSLSCRLKVFYAFLFVVFLIVFTRLWWLQILRGDYFFDLSENNRIKLQEITAPRGIIYDRNRVILADNIPSFDVSLLHPGVKNLEEILPFLSKALNIAPEEIVRRVRSSMSLPRLKPIKIKTDVERKELSLIEFFKLNLPNIVIEAFPKRNYPFRKSLSHVLGYLGEINETELKTLAGDNYGVGDYIGKSGAEKVFDRRLRGKNGWVQFEVDVIGRKKRVLSSFNPSPGENFYLTIDAGLQCFTDNALGDHTGAVVAIDPNNGEVLALVSHPSFDPNLFSRGISSKQWASLVNNPDCPLTNKAIQGLYPPGSLFKIITAISALEEKKITPETTFFCTDSFPFGNRVYHCWKKGGHGRLNLYKAIEQSCDIYFYNVGRLVGINGLARYAGLFGLGKPTGFVFKSEKTGLIPTKEWKKKIKKTPWQEGETLSSAIGQSFTLVTPLQMAVMISAIANNGGLYIPKLIKKITDNKDNLLKEFHPELASQVPVSLESIKVIKEALCGVIQSPHGTGRIARIEGIKMAGKTGTAQVVSLPADEKKSVVPLCFRDHAWFMAFAPFNNPRIAVVVLAEHGGSGSKTAGPIAREIINYYLSKPSR